MVPLSFTRGSRLILFAPHPDDETLACAVALQQAVGAGAAVRVVYATDGEDNPWPQRALERKWRLNAVDRERWGKLRRAEALAALRVLGVHVSDVRFLGLPDQGLTKLLMNDCGAALTRLTAIIADWGPTHVLAPSVADTHPDHNALGVMLRLVLAKLLVRGREMTVWSYAVHGKSAAFFDYAPRLRQSNAETAIKLSAIRRHKTQLKLSCRRFLRYAARPERFLQLSSTQSVTVDGSIVSVSARSRTLGVRLEVPVKLIHTGELALFVLGQGLAGEVRCLRIRIPMRSGCVQWFEFGVDEPIGFSQYRGNSFAGEIEIPMDFFSGADRLFIKLERRSLFFDEAGWIEIPPAVHRNRKREALLSVH